MLIVDLKREILTAMFVEYQKDIPNFNNVKRKFISAGLDKNEFNVAILKLDNEGYLNNVSYTKGGRNPFGIHSVDLDHTLLTGDTVKYLEGKLELELTDDNVQKSKNILYRFTEAGYERIESILTKTIAELIKS
ncbi:hypothetical protein V7114_20540 [Neobacillus niacini]|uniref:hypothetical protein n=1 Tax=Neobacillus niacini TaxID=86668 RepID=UPI0030007CD0